MASKSLAVQLFRKSMKLGSLTLIESQRWLILDKVYEYFSKIKDLIMEFLMR